MIYIHTSIYKRQDRGNTLPPLFKSSYLKTIKNGNSDDDDDVGSRRQCFQDFQGLTPQS